MELSQAAAWQRLSVKGLSRWEHKLLLWAAASYFGDLHEVMGSILTFTTETKSPKKSLVLRVFHYYKVLCV